MIKFEHSSSESDPYAECESKLCGWFLGSSDVTTEHAKRHARETGHTVHLTRERYDTYFAVKQT
jgi:hypothetical protein